MSDMRIVRPGEVPSVGSKMRELEARIVTLELAIKELSSITNQNGQISNFVKDVTVVAFKKLGVDFSAARDELIAELQKAADASQTPESNSQPVSQPPSLSLVPEEKPIEG